MKELVSQVNDVGSRILYSKAILTQEAGKNHKKSPFSLVVRRTPFLLRLWILFESVAYSGL